MILELMSIVIAVGGMIILSGGPGSVYMYMNLPSLICLMVLSLPILARNGLWKDFIRAFKLLNKKYHCGLSEMKRSLEAVQLMQKQILYAGIVITLLSMIYILLTNLAWEQFSANLGIALIEILYAAILELLLLPLHFETKRRIIDYMEEE